MRTETRWLDAQKASTRAPKGDWNAYSSPTPFWASFGIVPSVDDHDDHDSSLDEDTTSFVNLSTLGSPYLNCAAYARIYSQHQPADAHATRDGRPCSSRSRYAVYLRAFCSSIWRCLPRGSCRRLDERLYARFSRRTSFPESNVTLVLPSRLVWQLADCFRQQWQYFMRHFTEHKATLLTGR